MTVPNPAQQARRVGYRGLALLPGDVTLATFGTDRLLSETAGSPLGAVPAYVIATVVLAVGVGALRAAVHGHGVETAVLLALGPVGGFAAYLVADHLVRPPSTDSPTWLVFVGRFVERVTSGVRRWRQGLPPQSELVPSPASILPTSGADSTPAAAVSLPTTTVVT